MKRILLLFASAFISLGAGAQAQKGLNTEDWAGFGRYAQANETVSMGARAIFIGNSITDGWAKKYPDFFTSNNYIGRGIGGQVTSQMLVRFRADVLDLQPQCVVILAGTNDIAHNKGYISLENICGNIVSMAELAKAHKIKVIICSVLPVYQYPWRQEVENPAGKIIELNDMLKTYAEKNGCVYADYHSAMKDERNGLPEKYAKDGVHPTAEGYVVMQGIIKPVIDKAVGKK